MEAKRGIKTYGKIAVIDILNEYKQLYKLDVLGTQNATIMPCQEKYRALRAVKLIKEKRCGKIKGRMCADGSRQSTYIPRKGAMSLTIALEALFASLFIDAQEGRAVHTFDVPVEYLHSSLIYDKVLHMKFEGEFVDIMCEVNP